MGRKHCLVAIVSSFLGKSMFLLYRVHLRWMTTMLWKAMLEDSFDIVSYWLWVLRLFINDLRIESKDNIMTDSRYANSENNAFPFPQKALNVSSHPWPPSEEHLLLPYNLRPKRFFTLQSPPIDFIKKPYARSVITRHSAQNWFSENVILRSQKRLNPGS